jgi:hypothetical protein
MADSRGEGTVLNPQQARIVESRCLGCLSVEETQLEIGGSS